MLWKYLAVFLVSMIPVVELRGAIPIAVAMGIDPLRAVVICAVGNILPVPFIYFFARRFLEWGLEKRYIGGVCHFFHDRGRRAGRKMADKTGKYGLMAALILFVGIPIPGTGAWTGTLGASFLDMGLKETVISVCIGVMLAAAIMIALSLAGVQVFG